MYRYFDHMLQAETVWSTPSLYSDMKQSKGFGIAEHE